MLVSDSPYPKFWLRQSLAGGPLLYMVPEAGHAPVYSASWTTVGRWRLSQDFFKEAELGPTLALRRFGVNMEPATLEQAVQWQEVQGVPLHLRGRWTAAQVQEDFRAVD